MSCASIWKGTLISPSDALQINKFLAKADRAGTIRADGRGASEKGGVRGEAGGIQ